MVFCFSNLKGWQQYLEQVRMISDRKPLRKWDKAEFFLNLRFIPILWHRHALLIFLPGFASRCISQTSTHTCKCTHAHTRTLHAGTYSHVWFATRIDRLSNRVDQVATDSKVTHLHLAQCVNEHVRRLDVWRKEWEFTSSPLEGARLPTCLAGLSVLTTDPDSQLRAAARSSPVWAFNSSRFACVFQDCESQNGKTCLLCLSYLIASICGVRILKRKNNTIIKPKRSMRAGEMAQWVKKHLSSKHSDLNSNTQHLWKKPRVLCVCECACRHT